MKIFLAFKVSGVADRFTIHHTLISTVWWVVQQIPITSLTFSLWSLFSLTSKLVTFTTRPAR
eukprot:scaffold1888_cov120-Cylindrotheca_fusiformis.AAC.3